jgi:RNA polymerase sigma-70 factor (ECF subfamily)
MIAAEARSRVTGTNDETTIDVQTWESLRRYLFAIAYRMLGSASEAEDVVQDAYLRAAGSGAAHAESPRAYLATIVTRLCIDQLRSAKAKREVYVGPWLPEPAPTDEIAASPTELTERRDELSLAFLLLLERLTPEERAVYVLRDAFYYSFAEIAAMLDKPAATVRQHAHRARERVQSERPRFTAKPEQHRDLVQRFIDATNSGDLERLTRLLTADVVAWADGGAARQAARHPIVGADAVARGISVAVQKFFVNLRTTIEDLNGGLTLLYWDGTELRSAVALDVSDDGRISGLHTVVNPDKLAYLVTYVERRDSMSRAD